MPKSKRLTIRLDDELDAAIGQGCQDGKCDKTTVVINALKKGLGLGSPAPLSAAAKEVVQGKVTPKTYVIDLTGSTSKATTIIMEGKDYKYCEQCKKYYRRDASGNLEFYGPL